MNILWERGPSNVQAVQEALPGESAYTTVQTMLNVLHRKGRVNRTLRGRAYVYEPILSREKAIGHAIHDIVERLFGGSVEALLMTLVRTSNLDAKTLGKLRELVDRTGKRERHGNG